MIVLLRGLWLWALARAGEPSTWAGLAAAVGGMTFLPEARQWSQIVGSAGAVVCGIVAIARKERGGHDKLV